MNKVVRPILSETQIQHQCLLWLTAKKICHWRSNNIPVPIKDRFGKVWGFRPVYRKGLPDIFFLMHWYEDGHKPITKLYGVEIKSVEGRQSLDQKTFQKEFEESGGYYILVRSLDDLRKEIE